MTIKRSFKNFISNKYYNKIFEEIETFIESDEVALDIISYKLEFFEEFNLFDINILHVYIDGKFNGELSTVYILVSAQLELIHKTRHNEDYDQIEKWFMVSCKASLDNNLDDFEIVHTEEYQGKPKLEISLTDSLIPYTNKKDYDILATKLLEDVYPEALDDSNPTKVDPYLLAERLGLKVEKRHLSNDSSIFGQIIFQESEVEVYDGDTIVKEKFGEGTIIVDPNVFFFRNIGSLNNTIIHECVHWYYHRKGFNLEKLYDKDLSKLTCKVRGGIKGKKAENVKWMEIQANSIAPRILMPSRVIKTKYSSLMRFYIEYYKVNSTIDVIEQVINDLSDFFGVSRQSAKIRLIELGYEEAKGAYVYIDDRYVMPHYDKEYILAENETYSIDKINLAIEYIKNDKFRTLLNNGIYKYVDSHVCVNNPKYITKDTSNNWCLTDYARSNMYSCCLIFEVDIDYKYKDYSEYIMECYLCRVIDQELKLSTKFIPKGNLAEKSQEGMRNDYLKQVEEVLDAMPNKFDSCIRYLIEKSGMTLEEIGEKSGYDESSIRRLRDGKSKPNKRNLTGFCIALDLPKIISDELFARSSCRLTNTYEDLIFDHILMFADDIYEADKILKDADFKPISKEL